MRVEATRNGVLLRLTTEEATLLRRLRDGLHTLLREPDTQDPVVQRLFPTAVRGDDEADAELRRLVHTELLTSRLAGLDEIVEILDRGRKHRGVVEVELVEDEPKLLLGVLNDLRLATGARIGIDHLDRAALQPDDPVHGALAVMDHLAWLQEQILAVIDPPALSLYDDET